jgi:hypothetical protein
MLLRDAVAHFGVEFLYTMCKTARSGATTEVGAPAKQDWDSTL